ncbi:hypothetical protein J3B02_002111 [Coemansia erecta]|nr:hypothetical protein J3B02_002111 [Coemansia erecta]KAJ2877349.1 hypothetical protein FB639_003806 [Coemansia asiatica]
MKHYVRLWILFVFLQILILHKLYGALESPWVLAIKSSASDWLSQQTVYPCSFRKLPMVFEHGDGYYYVVWETTCSSESPLFKWWADGESTSKPTQYIEPWYKKLDNSHHRYAVIFGPVGEVSDVHYQVMNFRLSTKTYTIHRQISSSDHHRVLVISDNQNGPKEFREVLSTVKSRYAKIGSPHAILHVGDAVQNANRLSDWQGQLFSPMEDIVDYQHGSPIIFVPGNHDHDKARRPDNKNLYPDMYHGIRSTEGLSKDIVSNGTYHRFFHSVSVGSARIIVLDAECPSAEQTAFLKRELESTEFQSARFRIVSVHIPPFIEFWDPFAWNIKNEKHWGEHVRLEYDPLFRKYGVDLVISGHQHNYQRATIEYNGKNIISYAIVGGAGGTLDLVRVQDWKMYNRTYLGHHFVSLSISNSKLEWLAFNVAGSVIDRFSIER